MTVVIANTYGPGEPPANVPLRDNEHPYRFEMIFNNGQHRAYADTADELLAVLISGYRTMNPQQQLAARISLAVRTQVAVQADINAEYGFADCTPEEIVVLQDHRNTPPDIATWNCPVPLVLVDIYYKPLGEIPRPASGITDVAEPPNLLWLSPADPYEFLRSLHTVGAVHLSEHTDTRV